MDNPYPLLAALFTDLSSKPRSHRRQSGPCVPDGDLHHQKASTFRFTMLGFRVGPSPALRRSLSCWVLPREQGLHQLANLPSGPFLLTTTLPCGHRPPPSGSRKGRPGLDTIIYKKSQNLDSFSLVENWIRLTFQRPKWGVF